MMIFKMKKMSNNKSQEKEKGKKRKKEGEKKFGNKNNFVYMDFKMIQWTCIIVLKIIIYRVSLVHQREEIISKKWVS